MSGLSLRSTNGLTSQSAVSPALRVPRMKQTTFKRPRRLTEDSLRTVRCEEILEAAAELFAKHGYADTDTQLLADKLGIGKGTLYRYFPSKRELFLAAADRVMVRMRG